MDLKKYLEGLAQEAGLDDASKAVLLKAVENEKFSKPLTDGFLRQEDYSRNMDTLKQARTEFEGQQTSWRDWYKEAVARDAAREEEFQRARGTTTTTAVTTTPVTTGISKTDMDKSMDQTRGALIAVTKAMGTIVSRHGARFPGEELDVNAVEKIAIEKNIKVEDAYELMVAPRIAAKKESEFAEKLKQAREDGAREERSKHHIPDDAAAPRSSHLLFDRPAPVAGAAPLSERARVDSFADAWSGNKRT